MAVSKPEPVADTGAASELRTKLANAEKQLRDMEENNKQKQTHFINQSKKLSQERDDAVKAQKEIQEKCQEKMDKYDEIMADINLKLLQQEKQVGKFNFNIFSQYSTVPLISITTEFKEVD